MIFRFVVQHLRWLAGVPGLPQLFDSLLLIGTMLFNRRRLAAMETLEKAVLELPGVTLKVHRLGGMEFIHEGTELGHLHGNGLLDVRVGREQARALVETGRALPHHVFGDSAWLSFWLREPKDVPSALDLLKRALR
ncbi:MAG: DUF5519 family protein [Chthoniobacteraceae bacterium]